jgi:hypothetical protein
VEGVVLAFRSHPRSHRGVGSGVELELGAAAIVFAVVGGLVIAGNVAWPSLMSAGGPPLGLGGTSPPPDPLGAAGNGSTPGSPNASSGPGTSSSGGNVTVTPNGSSPGGPNGSTNGSGGPQWPLVGTPGGFAPGPVVASVSPSFFQLDIQTPNLTSPWLTSLLNETPFTYYSFGDAGESTNQVTDTAYASNGSVLAPSKSNDTNFIAFCREIHCHSIMSVPAEINNTSMDAATVAYIEDTLGFHPDYWGIGNEPQAWTHYNIPWPEWQPTDASNTTPLAYAREVQQIVLAIRSVDPNARIIGIESADGGSYNNSAWLDEVGAIDGPNLSAVAIHPYPDGTGPTDPTNASFYAGLSSSIRFPNNYQGLSASVDAACGCSLPIWVGEYNSALNGTYAPFEDGYPEVAYIAAGLAGAMKEGIPHVAFFALQHPPAMLINANQTPLPIFTLFSTFLKNITYGSVLGSSVTTSLGGVFAVTIENGSHLTLLVVNTNTTAALNLSIPSSMLSGEPLEWQAWRWAPEYPAPIVSSGGGAAPLDWVIPSQGVWMLNLQT